MRDGEGMMDTPMIVRHRVYRRVALHQDEARPGCIEEGHAPTRHGRQVPAADDFRVKPRASRDVTHGNAEMSNRLDRNHLTLPSC
jgi:hypothetical protein